MGIDFNSYLKTWHKYIYNVQKKYIVPDTFFFPRAQIDVNKYKLNVKSYHQKRYFLLKQIHQRTRR